MMQAPHRSLLFWFWLLGLTFLVWAWNDSRITARSITREGNPWFTFESKASALRFFLGRIDDNPGSALTRRTEYRERPVDHRPTPWLTGLSHSEEWQPDIYNRRTTEWTIPYWAITATYLPIWLALAFWRASRIRKGRQVTPESR